MRTGAETLVYVNSLIKDIRVRIERLKATHGQERYDIYGCDYRVNNTQEIAELERKIVSYQGIKQFIES